MEFFKEIYVIESDVYHFFGKASAFWFDQNVFSLIL